MGCVDGICGVCGHYGVSVGIFMKSEKNHRPYVMTVVHL